MSTDSTLLMREVQDIIENGEGHYNYLMDVSIRVGKEWIKPIRLDTTFLSRDYSNGQLGDIRTIEFLLGYGDLVLGLIPNRDNLLVDLTEIPLMESNSARDWDKRSVTKRYRGILNLSPGDDATLTSKHSQLTSREALNQVSLVPVQIQLVEELIYKYLMVTIGETYRQMTTKDVFVYQTKKTNDLLGVDLPIDFADGYNPDIKHQIPIPDGLPLKNLGHYLQENEGGIYPTGFGRYIQDERMYVYPLFDTTRYRKNTLSLNIINVPNDRYQGAEKTFKISNKHITILATGDASSLDNNLAQSLQVGNGLRWGDASKIFQNFSISKDNRMLVDRATNISEVVVKPLETGVNNVRWAKDRMSSNPYLHYTELARLQGLQIDLQWVHGDSNILIPGMPVRFMTISDNLVKTYHGVLLGVGERRTTSDSGAVVHRHVGIVNLSIFVNRFEVIDDITPTP